jgi:hypothetical protein
MDKPASHQKMSRGDRSLLWILGTWVASVVYLLAVADGHLRHGGPEDPVLGFLAAMAFFATAIWFNVAPVVVGVILLWRRFASRKSP